MINYYELLGVPQAATEDDIATKLKERKRIWTQRQNAPKPEQQQEASNNLRLIPEIEEALLNKTNRANYDQKLRNAPKAQQVDTSTINVKDLISEGLKLIANGNIPDALMVATKATEVHGDDPDAWALLGYAHSKWGEIDKAIYEYGRAIDKRPNDASFYFDLGGIYEDIEKWSDAMKQYQRAAQIDPSTTVYRAAMGSVYIKNELYKEGIELLEQCIQEEPDNEGYKYLLALAYNDSVFDLWTLCADDNYRCCTEESANEGLRRFDRALKLNLKDEEMNTLIKSNLELSKWAVDKHWGYSFTGTMKGGAAVFFGGLIVAAIAGAVFQGAGEVFSSIVAFLAFAGIGYLWVKFGFKPGWKINSNHHFNTTGHSS